MRKLQTIIDKIQPLNQSLMVEAQTQLDMLTKPQGSLGKLESLAKQVVGITGKSDPGFTHKAIFTFAGDHGVVASGVSAFPQEVTPQMVLNFLQGGAGINVLAKHVGARVIVADLGVATDLEPYPDLIIKKVDYGTKNMQNGPAMTREQAIQAIEAGIEIFEAEYLKGLDIVGTGDMGIGNTTPSSAITAVITKNSVDTVTGRGTGVDDRGLAKKISVIEQAIKINDPDPDDGLDVLAKVGGFEIGGLAGVILAAAAHRTPVVIDGFISGAAALIAAQIEPKTKAYMLAGHCSVEQGHKLVLNHLGLKPLLDLDLRLGEGTGAALGISLVEASLKIMTQMATFASAGVTKKS